MKKLIALLLAGCMLLSFFGCKASGQFADRGDPQGIAPPYRAENVEFNASYVRTDCYIDGAKFPQVVIARSLAELKDYYSGILADYYNKDLQTALSRYDESYFEKSILIMVLLEEPSGSIRHEVKRVEKYPGGSLNVVIDTTVPEVCTDDMAQWHIIIEPDAGVDVNGPEDVLINGVSTYGAIHNLAVDGDTWRLIEPLQALYRSGDTVFVRVDDPGEGELLVYLNGERLDDPVLIQKEKGKSYLEYKFTMPDKDSLLKLELEGKPEPLFNKYYCENDGWGMGILLSDEKQVFAVVFNEISSYQMYGSFDRTDNKLCLYPDSAEQYCYVFRIENDTLIFDLSASTVSDKHQYRFTDGAVFVEFDDPTSSDSYAPMPGPPEMKLVFDSNSAYSNLGGYTWHTLKQDGSYQGVTVDSLHILQCERILTVYYVTEGKGFLAFGDTEPTTITGRCWPASALGDMDAQSQPVTIDGINVVVNPGDWVYELEATWNHENYYGTAKYFLCIVYREDTTVSPPYEDWWSDSTDMTQSPDAQLRIKVFRTDGTARYLNTQDSDAVRSILTGLVYSQEEICRCPHEYAMKLEGETEYYISITEGFARCELGQAQILEEDLDVLAAILCLTR